MTSFEPTGEQQAIIGRYPHIAGMPLSDLHDFQIAAKARQAESFQAHLARKGSAEVVDPSWPSRPWTPPPGGEPA